MSQEWNRRVDKTEASAKRKAKEVKNREFFEKVNILTKFCFKFQNILILFF